MDEDTIGWCFEPSVMISDFDKAFKRAARASFPDTVKHQLCVWHILKNVAHNIKKKWHGTLEGTVLGHRGGGAGSADPGEKDDDEEDQGDDDPNCPPEGNIALDPQRQQLDIEHPDENIRDTHAGSVAGVLLDAGDKRGRSFFLFQDCFNP